MMMMVIYMEAGRAYNNDGGFGDAFVVIVSLPV